jgi:hypothetical protein
MMNTDDLNTHIVKTLEVFPWNRNFDTDIELIDQQHKKLVCLLNQLASHLAYQADIPTLVIGFYRINRLCRLSF